MFYDENLGAWRFGNVAEICKFTKKKVPPVADYPERCRDLIRETFQARSQHAMCQRAHGETGIGPDKFDRILNRETKSPDAQLILAVLMIRATRNLPPFDLGNGFVVRVMQEAHP